MGALSFNSLLSEPIYPGSSYYWRNVFIGQQASNPTLVDRQHAWGTFTSERAKENLIYLFKNVIEPATSVWGKLTFSSCYRSYVPPDGATGSAHLVGCAVDITGYGRASKAQFYEWLSANKCGVIDQCLYEWARNGGKYPTPGGWIHVGVKILPNGNVVTPRKMWLNYDNHKSAGNVQGLVCGQQNTATESGSDKEPGRNADTVISKDASEDSLRTIKSNLSQIENNIQALEAEDVDVIWGSRSNNSLEKSDWIGLRQYILYLSTTFTAQSLVPFIELIPKFFLDNPLSEQSEGNSNDEAFKLSQTEIERAAATRNKMKILNENGGIDLITLDPFQDYSNSLYDDNENNIAFKAYRGIGYRIFGSIVLTPDTKVKETSKAGSVGFQSLEIQEGLQTNNKLATVIIKLLDTQGNKFLDISSPWSFLLNSSAIGGDFYFRYGWQLQIPDLKDIKVPNSISNKYWNHPGWGLFGDGVKSAIQGKAQMSEWTINLTQSSDLNSFWYNGASTLKNEKGVAEFFIDRKLDPSNYNILNLINPEISIDDKDGSIIATLQYRVGSAMANCMVPAFAAKKTQSYVTDLKDGSSNLYDLMKRFIADNYDNISSNPNSSLEPINPNIDISSKIKVIGTNSSNHYDARDVKVKISNARTKELNGMVGNANSNTLLSQWLDGVLLDNKISLQGTGSLTGSASANGLFTFIIDEVAGDETPNTLSPATLGFITSQNDIGRLSLQDDVFSFRFRGSLLESLKVESSDNTNQFTIQAENEAAKEIAGSSEVKSGGTDNNKKGEEPIKEVTKISFKEKKRNLHMQFNKMSTLTIKAIGHPWIIPGEPIFIKGSGYFDDRYMVATIKHAVEEDNTFTSEIVCVRTANDQDYAKLSSDLNKAQEQAQNNPSLNKAEPVIEKRFVRARI